MVAKLASGEQNMGALVSRHSVGAAKVAALRPLPHYKSPRAYYFLPSGGPRLGLKQIIHAAGRNHCDLVRAGRRAGGRRAEARYSVSNLSCNRRPDLKFCSTFT